MDIRTTKKEIRDIKKQLYEVRGKVATCQDIDKLNEYNELVTSLQKKRYDLENQLDDLEEQRDYIDPNIAGMGNGVDTSWQRNESRRSKDFFNPMDTYMQADNRSSSIEGRGQTNNMNMVGSYGVNNGIGSIDTSEGKKYEPSGLELRSDESLVERIIQGMPKEQQSEARNLDLGKYVRGMVTGDWKNADAEKRAMTTSVTGIIIPQILSARLIDLARNQSLFALAKVPVIPMKDGNLKISKLKNDPVFKFKEEGKAVEESNFEIESIDLESKTAYGYAYVSLEAIKSSANLRSVLETAFSKATAECVDMAMLYSQYTGEKQDAFAPSGIMNDDSIHSIVATGGYDDFIKAISKIKTSNGVPTFYGINAQTEEILSTIKDNNGQYLNPPKIMDNLKPIVTNQLKSTAEGNDALVFDPKSMIIGMHEHINIKLFEGDTECIKKGLVCFRVSTMLDCKVTQPKNICKITGFKN